jgi:hypothetical protein
VNILYADYAKMIWEVLYRRYVQNTCDMHPPLSLLNSLPVFSAPSFNHVKDQTIAGMLKIQFFQEEPVRNDCWTVEYIKLTSSRFLIISTGFKGPSPHLPEMCLYDAFKTSVTPLKSASFSAMPRFLRLMLVWRMWRSYILLGVTVVLLIAAWTAYTLMTS